MKQMSLIIYQVVGKTTKIIISRDFKTQQFDYTSLMECTLRTKNFFKSAQDFQVAFSNHFISNSMFILLF